PSATVKATLSPAQVMALRGGGTVTESVALDVSLYGTTVSKTAELLVSVLDDDVRVTSTQPIMITAQDFGLESGVAALQKIAGLSAISRSIPITVDLRLKAN
ncbi:MAG: YceI family protein, partial [Proteobacteria bacterium]|nr:YceI family protein [Pseudomonadota bacterium]